MKHVKENVSPEVLRVLEKVPDLYLVLSCEFAVLTASDAYLAATGLERKRLVGKPVAAALPSGLVLCHPDFSTRLANSLQQVLITKQPDELPVQKYTFPASDPVTTSVDTYWLIRNTPVLDTNGEVQFIILKADDVTAQKKAEQVYTESSQILHKITDVQPVSISVLKAVRDEHNRITDLEWTFANSFTERFTGGRRLIGQRYLDVFPGMKSEGVWDSYCRVIETGERIDGEWHLDRDGLSGWYRSLAVKLGDGILNIGEDITERKTAELELLQLKDELAQRATDKYKSIINTMDEGFCIIEVLFDDKGEPFDCRFLEINQVFEQQTGLKGATGKTVLELGTSLEESWYQYYGSVAKTGKPIHFENRAAALEGGAWYEVSAFRVGNPEDHQVAVLFKDVTKRKKAEYQLKEFNELLEQQVNERTNALKENKELLNSVLENTSSSFMALKAVRDNAGAICDFEYLYTNSRALEAVSHGSLVGKRLTEVVPDVLQADIFASCVEVVETGRCWNAEVHGNYKGSEVWSQVYATKLADGLLITYSDTTERKKVEQELREAQLFTEQVMEATPDFIMVFNLLTNKVEYVNQNAYRGNDERFYETLHLNYEQILGRAHPDDREALHGFINAFRTAPDNEVHMLDYRVINQDKVFWYRARGKVFKRDETGQATHYISVVQDISKVMQLEEENLQMKLDQQKNTMIAILEAQEEERRRISESLHNGVGQLLYAAKLNLERADSNLAPEEKFEALKSSRDLLLEAIKQTRQVSHELVPALLKDFGLENALRDLCAMYDSSAIFLNCVVKGIDERLEPHLEVAVYRITQELINNIVKHAEASAATIQLSQSQKGILLQTRDNGKGMDPGAAGRKGIGLKTIADRVKLLNGTLSITTPKTGKGTQVSILLPLS